jgi:hypothetical protein
MKCALIFGLLAFGAASIAVAAPPQQCDSLTKIILSGVKDVEQIDRDELCRAIGQARADSGYSAETYTTVLSIGSRLRKSGYRSQSLYPELMIVASLRPPSDLEMLHNAYVHSHGCFMPSMLVEDIVGTLKDAKTKKDRDLSTRMFKNFDRDGFSTYMAMVSQLHGCTMSK